MAIFKLVEENLLDAVVLPLGHASVPEPHRAFLPERIDEVLVPGEVSWKTVGHTPAPNIDERRAAMRIFIEALARGDEIDAFVVGDSIRSAVQGEHPPLPVQVHEYPVAPPFQRHSLASPGSYDHATDTLRIPN
jgi:hypothetical protein